MVRAEGLWGQAFWNDCLLATLVEYFVAGERVLRTVGCCVDTLVRLNRIGPSRVRLRVGEVEDHLFVLELWHWTVVHWVDSVAAALHF